MQLAPGEKFAIVRQLGDPTDANTYYVQAIVRNAHTDDLLDTMNLTDRGSRRFSALWNVYSKKNDGFYISITTTVYTDSGYTTKSDVYTEESETYLIERRDYHAGFSDGGIGAKKVREIVTEVVAAALAQHTKAIDSRLESLGGEPTDPAETYDDTEVLTAITGLTAAVRGIEVKPEVKVTVQPPNFAPLLASLEKNGEAVAKLVKDGIAGTTGAVAEVLAGQEAVIKEIRSLVTQGNLLDFVKELGKNVSATDTSSGESVPTYQEVIRSIRHKS